MDSIQLERDDVTARGPPMLQIRALSTGTLYGTYADTVADANPVCRHRRPTPTELAEPDANADTAANPLTDDGNLEMWLYQIPAYADVADLSAGDEVPFTQLGGRHIHPGNEYRSEPACRGPALDHRRRSLRTTTMTQASMMTAACCVCVDPRSGSAVGNALSDRRQRRDLYLMFAVQRHLGQVTKTPRGVVSNPIYSKNPTISGNGLRVAFTSTGDNPIVGMTGGNNPIASRNEEIYLPISVAAEPDRGNETAGHDHYADEPGRPGQYSGSRTANEPRRPLYRVRFLRGSC